MAALLAFAAACALTPAAARAAAPPSGRTVLLAFLPFDTRPSENQIEQPSILDRLSFHPELSLLTSVLFAALILALAAREFVTKDY